MQVGFAIHLLQLDHLTDRVRYGAIQRIVTQLPVPMSIRERVSIGAAVVGIANVAVVVFAIGRANIQLIDPRAIANRPRYRSDRKSTRLNSSH